MSVLTKSIETDDVFLGHTSGSSTKKQDIVSFRTNMSMGYACMAEVHICFSAADKCIADEISGFQMFYFSYFTLSYKAIAFELFTLSLCNPMNPDEIPNWNHKDISKPQS